MIAQCHIDGCDGAQLFEESKKMREAFRNVEQVPGDHNPIRAKFPHSVDDTIVPRTISVQVQISDMDGPATGERRMTLVQDRDVMMR
jgi:hypothetical protein